MAQKSKTKWLKEGDSNNKIFHKVASNWARNIISKIQDSAGSIVESPNEIEKVLVGFFHILFNKNQHCRPFLDGLDLLKIKEKMRSELEINFSLEEVKHVVFSFPKDKAPGCRALMGFNAVLSLVLGDCEKHFFKGDE